MRPERSKHCLLFAVMDFKLLNRKRFVNRMWVCSKRIFGVLLNEYSVIVHFEPKRNKTNYLTSQCLVTVQVIVTSQCLVIINL